MKRKGFTLVEIMVVITIIVILVMIVIAAGDSAKSIARDNQRKTDMALLQIKLESYFDIYGVYPLLLSGAGQSLDHPGPSGQGQAILVTSAIPIDPQTKAPYTYFQLSFSHGVSCGVSYYLYATLENSTNSTHPTIHSLYPCASGSWPTLTSKIYDVTSPSAFNSQ